MSKGDRLERKGEYREAAEWFKQHGQYLDAARCWEKGQYRDDIIKAAACYVSAGLPKKAAECLERHGREYEAIKVYEEQGDYLRGCPTCRGNSLCGRVTTGQLYATASFLSTAFDNASINVGICR